MVVVRLAANETAAVAGHNVRPWIAENRPLGADLSMPVVAALRAGQGRCVVVEGPGQQVLALSPPRDRRERPQLAWQRSGRGMRDGSRAVGPLAADLDGDGPCEVVVADQAREGHARLVAYRGDGTALWDKAFPQTGGAAPVWNVGGLTFWWPGRFRRADALDLFVNTRRGLMHSDVGCLLDGRNATTLWTCDKAELPGEFRWGYSGVPLAAADVDADRLDEGNVGQTTSCKHALTDIDGDGKSEIASAGYGGGVCLIDPRTGKVLWSFAAPAPTVPRVTAANLDGQGGDEIIYPAGNTLVVVTGDRAGGRLLWTWQAPAALSLPAIADVDGDGLAEIVVQDSEANVHCLGAVPPREPK